MASSIAPRPADHRSQHDPIEARLQLAAIVDSSDDAIISKNLQGIITSWNAAATRVFGYQPDEIIGRSVLTLIPEELHSEEPEILRKVASGERIEHYETRRRRKDGELLQISLTISPIRDGKGRIVGISKIARDITQRKLTEAALFESDRMAAIGRLAASIAHEVNNPLEAILNLAYLLERHPSLDDEARAYTKLMLDEVVRVSEITRRTLSFYRDTTHPIEIDMMALVDGVVKLHQPLLDQKSVQLVTRYSRPAYVWGRPGELRQVLTNLLGNAIDALPQGGVVRISVNCGNGAEGARISISDNGPGIPKELREKIFQPFFSTKQSKGTGLGLWISQAIVRKYGGHIRMRSWAAPNPRTGTIFRVTLPAHC